MDENSRKKENVGSETKVLTKEYTIQIGDTFWKIAEKELGSGLRWQSIYELNKDKIKGPNKLKAGQKIIIPVKGKGVSTMTFDNFSKVTTSRSFPKVDEVKLQQIREMAYHIWEKKGKPVGRDWENWLQAEKQIRAKSK